MADNKNNYIRASAYNSNAEVPCVFKKIFEPNEYSRGKHSYIFELVEDPSKSIRVDIDQSKTTPRANAFRALQEGNNVTLIVLEFSNQAGEVIKYWNIKN